jgi:hypothetical protein
VGAAPGGRGRSTLADAETNVGLGDSSANQRGLITAAAHCSSWRTRVGERVPPCPNSSKPEWEGEQGRSAHGLLLRKGATNFLTEPKSLLGVERKLVALGLVVVALAGVAAEFGSASSRPSDQDSSPLAAGRVTIHAPSLVPSDHPIPLYGTAEGAAPGDMVEIQSKDCGTTFFRGVSATRTQRAGQWSADFYPGITTWVRAVWKGRASKAVRVRQQAALQFTQRPFRRHRFVVSVVAKAQFWHRRVTIERYHPRDREWQAFRTVLLTTQNAPGQIVWTSGEFTARLPEGTALRAVLPASEALPCYASGTSLVLRTVV